MILRRRPYVLALAALVALFASCRQPAPVSTDPLRIAVLPILDTLPIYVAEAEEHFADEGIAVELVPAASAAERDQLLQSGQVDGVITDLVALALYNRETTEVVAVRYAMVPTERFAQFRILAAGDAGIAAPTDLRNVPIGVSEGTIIEYVTYRMLTAEGLAPGEIATLAVPRIPERMALLNAGELEAATLPEPLASLAMEQGAVVVVDDTSHPEASASLFAFAATVTDGRPEDVSAFLRAIDRASAAINENKAQWSDLLTENELVPPPIAGSYTLPDYPRGGAPTAEQFADVTAWLIQEDRLTTAPDYDAVVDTSLME